MKPKILYEEENLTFKKRVISVSCLVVAICGMAWTVLYYVLGAKNVALAPMIYSLTVPTLYAGLRKRNFETFVHIQSLAIMLLPLAVHCAFGSFESSGGVLVWTLIGPLTAMFYFGSKYSKIWLALWGAVLCAGVCCQALGPFWEKEDPLPGGWNLALFAMNFGCVALILYLSNQYFIGKNEEYSEKIRVAHRQLNEQYEELRVNSEELISLNAQLDEAAQTLARQNEDILDSIRYAQRIQKAMLPQTRMPESLVSDCAVLYRPKDIVSGDFYWFASRENSFYVAVGDCTGHGVPGALLSVLGSTALTHILNEGVHQKPGEILTALNRYFLRVLAGEQNEQKIQDGMDVCLVRIQRGKNEIEYAGAKRPLIRIHNGFANVRQTDRHSIGFSMFKDAETVEFETFVLDIHDGDVLYLASDGLTDQFDATQTKKFGQKRLKDLLEIYAHLPLKDQIARVEKALDEWRNETEQTDDILVLAFKPQIQTPEMQSLALGKTAGAQQRLATARVAE